MFHVRQRRTAMTAIEVLAATVLASLMFASVVGVLSGLARQQSLLTSRTPRPAWHQQLAANLEWDLKNSRTMTVLDGGVHLEGFAGRDLVTGRPTGRPTTVDYYIDRRVSPGVLLRRETHTDEASIDNARVELVCTGVDQLMIGDARTDENTAAATTQRPRPVPIPQQVGLVLFGADSSEPMFSHRFVVH